MLGPRALAPRFRWAVLTGAPPRSGVPHHPVRGGFDPVCRLAPLSREERSGARGLEPRISSPYPISLPVRGVARAARRWPCLSSASKPIFLVAPAGACFRILEQESSVGTLNWGFVGLRPVPGTPQETWCN